MINPVLFNIEEATVKNENFRHVIYTHHNSQLALMSLLPGEEIGTEVHQVDQFIRIERGIGKAIINEYSFNISDGIVVVVPAGNQHNIINTGSTKMKLYTIYSPPNEPVGLIQQIKPPTV